MWEKDHSEFQFLNGKIFFLWFLLNMSSKISYYPILPYEKERLRIMKKMNVPSVIVTFFQVLKYAMAPLTRGPLHMLCSLPQSVSAPLTWLTYIHLSILGLNMTSPGKTSLTSQVRICFHSVYVALFPGVITVAILNSFV